MIKTLKQSIIILLIIGMVTIGSATKAQSNWEVGARFVNIAFALDASIPLEAPPRLYPEIHISDRFGVGGYFDWMLALSGGAKGLKFCPGVGPETIFENGFDFNIASDLGTEYSFKFPQPIGFDWRPGFRVTDGYKFKSSHWGFIDRFMWGEGVKFNKADQYYKYL